MVHRYGVSFLALLLFVAASSHAAGDGTMGGRQAEAIQASLAGDWVTEVGETQLILQFGPEDRYRFDSRTGTYRIEANKLICRSEGAETTYQFQLVQNALTLSGGDLLQAMTFSRQTEPASVLRSVFRVSWRSTRTKLLRIAVIGGVVFACRVLIFLLNELSRWLIFSTWGPLRFVYRHNKSRTLTVNSIVLNLVKYVVYFTAFGFILSELGVNYTAYLASLSVIGLAIGFGSQGLVQDVVTGFFILFESQFDVGDMVDISGQTGIVEELGLRMTRLRNYLGQVVVIPNRNIAVVGRYSTGALPAFVDVAVGSPEDGEKALPVIRTLCTEIGRQFQGVVRTEPEVIGPLSLSTGEHFVRVKVAIWPAQQWVVDQQLVPRIRETLKRAGIEIPGDRIAAFYSGPEKQQVRKRPKQQMESSEGTV